MTATLPPPPVPSAVWMPGEVPKEAPYRSARRLGQLVMVALVVAAVTRAVAAASALADYRFIGALLETPVVLDRSTVSDRVQRTEAIDGLAIASLVATGVLFIAWLHRVYANLPSLGARGRRFGSGWAVGAWFVPFLNLVRPKQIVDDTWRASDPEGTAGEEWSTRSVPGILHLWWGLFVGVGVLTWTVDAKPTDPTGAHEGLRLLVLANAAAVAAAVVALVVVGRLSDRQALRARIVNGAELSTDDLGRSRPWAVGAAVALSAFAFVVTTASISVDAAGAGVGGGHGRFISELEVGDCWLDPGSLRSSDVGEGLLTVDVVNCGARHDFEVIAVMDHPLETEDDPTDALLQSAALGACSDAFLERLVDAASASGLDVVAIWPTMQSWAAGDRSLTCSAVRVDGMSLTAPLP